MPKKQYFRNATDSFIGQYQMRYSRSMKIWSIWLNGKVEHMHKAVGQGYVCNKVIYPTLRDAIISMLVKHGLL